MFGLNDNQKQINESLKPINSRLDSHSKLLDEMIRFKCECTEHRRRFDDKLKIIEQNQNKICETLKEAQIYHEKNSENLQTLTEVMIAAKAGKKSIPVFAMLIGAGAITITVIVWFVHYLNKIIEAIN